MNLQNSYLSASQDTQIDKRTGRKRRRRKKKRPREPREEEQEVVLSPPEKGEEGENKGGTVTIGKREDGEETMMTEQAKVAAMMRNIQRGVTWSENDDSNGRGETETSPTSTAPGRHERERRRITPTICQQEGRSNRRHGKRGWEEGREEHRSPREEGRLLGGAVMG